MITGLRALGAALCLAGIVSFYHLVLHANPTTVALTLLLLILFVAAYWGLRFAIFTSLAATACYNFFFLPPLNTFTVADPQNLLALVVFLITSVFGSRLSDRIRRESQVARERQAEIEVLYRLSRSLLQTEELVQLTNSIPRSVASATDAKAVLFYLLDGDRIYRTGADWPAQLGVEELRRLAHEPSLITSAIEDEAIIPLRTGVRPRGALVLRGVALSQQSLEAVGGLVSVSLDKARAIEEVTRAEASKESERLRGLILDAITHELRTPLTSIKASVGTLLSSDLPVDASRDLLMVIDEESDRLDRLVAQAVEMSQLDTQEVRMDFSAQRMQTLIETAMETSKTALAEHPITVTLSDSLPTVYADPLWIQKLLSNLLENASKYSANGQPIFLSAELRDQFIACSVADRGVGIDTIEQALIFDKFYRARNHMRKAPGTGMGLAISRAIAEAHGGTIMVTSQVGQGSVFTFTLPVDASALAPSSNL